MSHKLNDGFSTGDKPKSGELEIQVIRANGDVENYGVVSKFYRNPIKTYLVNRLLKRKLSRRIKNGS